MDGLSLVLAPHLMRLQGTTRTGVSPGLSRGTIGKVGEVQTQGPLQPFIPEVSMQLVGHPHSFSQQRVIFTGSAGFEG